MGNKIEAGDIRVGNILNINDNLYKVLETTHVKPGKGGAFSQIVAKQINKKEQKLNLRYRTDEVVDQEFIYEAEGLFIDKTKESCTFLNIETSEMIELDNDLIDNIEFLQDNMKIKLLYTSTNEYIGIRLPQKITVTVIDAPVFIKGQTEKASDKVAILDNGVKVKIPQYINNGEKIIISFDNENKVYFIERV